MFAYAIQVAIKLHILLFIGTARGNKLLLGAFKFGDKIGFSKYTNIYLNSIVTIPKQFKWDLNRDNVLCKYNNT